MCYMQLEERRSQITLRHKATILPHERKIKLGCINSVTYIIFFCNNKNSIFCFSDKTVVRADSKHNVLKAWDISAKLA